MTALLATAGHYLWGGMILEGEGQNFSEGGTECQSHLDMRYKVIANVTLVTSMLSDCYQLFVVCIWQRKDHKTHREQQIIHVLR